MTEPDGIRAFVAQHAEELAADLDEWLRIPGISAQPQYHDDVQRSADWLEAAFTRTGMPLAEVWPTDGLPAVYAEWPSEDPGAPTVLVYGHHDVQPVDPLELWEHPPFEPTRAVVDGVEILRARGASDDKGQLLFHLLGLRAHLAQRAAQGKTTPAVTLKFLIEGEEESGSPNLAAPAPACAGWCPAGLTSPGPGWICTPGYSAARCRTRPLRWPAWSRRCTTTKAGSRCPASTTTCWP